MTSFEEDWFTASDSTASNTPVGRSKSKKQKNSRKILDRGNEGSGKRHKSSKDTSKNKLNKVKTSFEDENFYWGENYCSYNQGVMKNEDMTINNNLPTTKQSTKKKPNKEKNLKATEYEFAGKNYSVGNGNVNSKMTNSKVEEIPSGNQSPSPPSPRKQNTYHDSSKHLPPNQGKPVPVLIQNEESGMFELDEEALSSILLTPGVADKHVCVLAVAGAFRKGKSFLLDFLLRYCHNRDSEDWLGDPKVPLKGFKWRQGSRRETTGIMMWNKPFLVKKKSGEEVAVILVDTQGTFDTQSSMKDSTVVFALTMMVSSVLVYNIMNNIQEDDLMNLQTFTSYGVEAQEDCDSSHAFQRLLFLVRDWNFPYEVDYGYKGGQCLLDEILQITSKQHIAHQDVRRDIRKCFRDINCYLMPHPGFTVINNAEFDGRLEQIEKAFTEHLRILVPRLLAPENLIKKEFGGQPIKAKDLFKLFQTFMEVFKDIDLPEPTTLVEFAARASSKTAVDAAREQYVESMECLVGGDRPFLKTVQMEAEHEKEKAKAVASYHEKNRYGRKNQRVVEIYEAELTEEIDKLYVKYLEQNEAKNVFKAARTPATLFTALVFFYLLSGVFGLFGMYGFAGLCNMAMGFFVIMLTLWSYVRYSGEYRDVGVYIDESATVIWDSFLSPAYSTYMEEPLKMAAEKAAAQAMSSTLTNGLDSKKNT